MEDSLYIVGKGRGWQDAPYEGNVWGITQLILRRNVTLVIDMNVYKDDRWGIKESEEAELARRIADTNGIPYVDLETYPISTIIRDFGTTFFNSTVDYALALAIHKGYKDIHLYGVNMELGTEYEYQFPGVTFWCGVAQGRGVKVTVHGVSRVMKTSDGLMYGYGTKQIEGE
jgi:hypothetical protein